MLYKLDQRCDVCREGSEELIINLVLDVSGPVFQFGYAGLRTGRLWRAERVLMIQAAVPTPLETDVWDFLEDVLRGALALATEYVADHKLGYSLKAVTKCIDEVIAALPRTKEPN